MEFSRQEYWNGLPSSSPGDLPNLGIEPRSPALQADSLSATREAHICPGSKANTGDHPQPLQGPQGGQAPSPDYAPISQVSCMIKPSGTTVEGQFPDVALTPTPPAPWPPYNKLSCWGLKCWGWGCWVWTDVWVILSQPQHQSPTAPSPSCVVKHSSGWSWGKNMP